MGEDPVNGLLANFSHLWRFPAAPYSYFVRLPSVKTGRVRRNKLTRKWTTFVVV